eukprot:scaffold34371_cov168-Skeletonema_marinoi.AAC.1
MDCTSTTTACNRPNYYMHAAAKSMKGCDVHCVFAHFRTTAISTDKYISLDRLYILDELEFCATM